MRERKRIRTIIPPILQGAKENWRRATPAEEVLWGAVRKQHIRGAPFRRQHPVGQFILDFYCPGKKLCVEVDGAIHDEQQERDEQRPAALVRSNIRVIRFRNEEVLHDLASVIQKIEAALDSAP